jgi:hypothetical protein
MGGRPATQAIGIDSLAMVEKIPNKLYERELSRIQ